MSEVMNTSGMMEKGEVIETAADSRNNSSLSNAAFPRNFGQFITDALPFVLPLEYIY